MAPKGPTMMGLKDPTIMAPKGPTRMHQEVLQRWHQKNFFHMKLTMKTKNAAISYK